MTTKTDTPAVPAWALEAAREMCDILPGYPDAGRIAAIIARHAAQAQEAVLEDWAKEGYRQADEEYQRNKELAAANAELLGALRTIATFARAEWANGMGWGAALTIADDAERSLAKHTPKEGA